jgi:hypothetical protein
MMFDPIAVSWALYKLSYESPLFWTGWWLATFWRPRP